MHYRELGQSGIEASAIAFGAWAIGGWMWGGTEEKAAIDAIHAALDEGITLIDTAAIYGFGRSEEIVGKALKDRRDKAVVATKCGLVWDREKGEYAFSSDKDSIKHEDGSIKVYRYLGPESIREEVEKSLKRLQTDYIDLYQTHWQEATTPLEDTMGELLKLRDEGKIRAIGPCNINLDQIKAYTALGPIATAQQQYSMIERGLEDEVLPFCRDNNIGILAYSPLALGLLTGKVGPDRTFPESDFRSTHPRFAQDNRARVAKMLEAFQPVADEHNATLAQIVIAWTIHQPGITHALVGARTPEQARENAAAGKVTLSPEDLAALDKAIAEHGPGIV